METQVAPDSITLLKAIDTAYGTRGLSPRKTVEAILKNCHPHVKALVRSLVTACLHRQRLDELDKVLVNGNVDPHDGQRWVGNTRSIAENCLQHGLFAEVSSLQDLPDDVRLEVHAVLKPELDALAQRKAEDAARRSAPQSSLVQPAIIVGPLIGGPQTQQPPAPKNPPPPTGPLPGKLRKPP